MRFSGQPRRYKMVGMLDDEDPFDPRGCDYDPSWVEAEPVPPAPVPYGALLAALQAGRWPSVRHGRAGPDVPFSAVALYLKAGVNLHLVDLDFMLRRGIEGRGVTTRDENGDVLHVWPRLKWRSDTPLAFGWTIERFLDAFPVETYRLLLADETGTDGADRGELDGPLLHRGDGDEQIAGIEHNWSGVYAHIRGLPV